MLFRSKAPILKAILWLLEKAFAVVRSKSTPPFPYDMHTQTIVLPADVEKEIRHLVLAGNKIEAVRKVTKFTGAGLRLSKGYVDSLAENSVGKI